MPYIIEDDRQQLNPEIDALAEKLKTHGGYNGGHMNYAITRLVHAMWKMRPSYLNGAAIMGLLICVTFEFYRRILAKYEDKKIKENGDL